MNKSLSVGGISSHLKIDQSHFEKSGNESVDCKEPLCALIQMFDTPPLNVMDVTERFDGSQHENRKQLGYVFSHGKFTSTFVLQQ